MALAVGYDAQALRRQLDELDFGTLADYGALGKAELPVNLVRLHGATPSPTPCGSAPATPTSSLR